MTIEQLRDPNTNISRRELENIARADLRDNSPYYVDDPNHAPSLITFQIRRDSLLNERSRQQIRLRNATARLAINSVDEDEQLRIQAAWAELDPGLSQSPRLQTARWARPSGENGQFEVDTSPRDETFTPLLGTPAFGVYTIWVASGETYYTRRGDEILFSLAGQGSTVQYDCGYDLLGPGKCALVEGGRPARFRAGRTALVMLGVGDSRLWTGEKEVASYVEQATWATSPDDGVLQVDTSPGPIPMAKSEGFARELVACRRRMGANIIGFEAGKKVLPHRHDAEHMLPVTDGSGIVMYLGKDYTPKPGTIYYIGRQELHAVYAAQDRALHLIAVSNQYEPPDSAARLEMAA